MNLLAGAFYILTLSVTGTSRRARNSYTHKKRNRPHLEILTGRHRNSGRHGAVNTFVITVLWHFRPISVPEHADAASDADFNNLVNCKNNSAVGKLTSLPVGLRKPIGRKNSPLVFLAG